MKYARYHHETHRLEGLYDDALNKVIPSRCVLITDEQHADFVQNGHRYTYRLDTEEWIETPITLDVLNEVRRMGEIMVDQLAEGKRAEYLTLTGGQDTIYTIKYDEAVAYLDAGGAQEDLTDYAYVKAEYDALRVVGGALTGAEVAQTIVDKRNLCVALGAEIERERRSGKERIARANSRQDVTNIVEHVRTQMQEIGS